MAPQPATLAELRTFATDNGLTLDDAELQARLDLGSANSSMNRTQYLLGFFPELRPNDIV